MSKTRILVGALSALGYHERRERCRATWMADIRRMADLDAVFLIGSGGTVRRPTRADDLLLLPCPDDYASLPQKTRWFCRWALDRCDFEYLLKCDDDTYVAAERLRDYATAGRSYIGRDIGGYASGGGGYLLSRRAAELVADGLLSETGSEDLLVGDLLRRAGIDVSDDCRFTGFSHGYIIPREDNDLITAHGISGQTFLEAHRRVSAPWRFRIVMPTNEQYLPAARASLALLDRYWPDHPGVDLVFRGAQMPESLGDRQFHFGNPRQTSWTRAMLDYLRDCTTDELVLLMLDDYGLFQSPDRAALLQAQRTMLHDPSLASFALTWQPVAAEPYPAAEGTGLYPRWPYSVNTQAAVWRRASLVRTLLACGDLGVDEFELRGSTWHNAECYGFERHAGPRVACPPAADRAVDESDKSGWTLAYHNLMRRGRPDPRHDEFLADQGIALS